MAMDVGTNAVDDIFVSYSSADRNTAERVVTALRQQKLQVWYDQSMLAGEKIDATIEEKLRAAKCVVVLWSGSSVKKDWVKAEAEHGRKSPFENVRDG
jgi:hypothetical protein